MDKPTKELCDAIESHDDEIEKIKSLLEEKVDPNSRIELREEDDDASLVHKAAAQGSEEIVQALLDAGADPDVEDKHGKTPLHEAARNESKKITSVDAKIVEVLLDAGLDPNALQQTESAPFGVEEKKETPLHKAVQSSGDSARQVVEALLGAGADPNIENENGETPLHLASRKADDEVVSLLLEEGADLNLASAEEDSGLSDASGGDTPLHMAAGEGNAEIVRALLEAGANPSTGNAAGKRPIHKAAAGGWVDTVKFLLEERAMADARDEVGRTPLHEAASSREQGGFATDENDPEGTIRALTEAGGDPNVEREEGSSPLGFSGEGSTPLHQVAYSGRVNNAEVLIEVGADVNARNSEGQTPLHIAAGSGEQEMVSKLVEAGAEVDMQGTVSVGIRDVNASPLLGAVSDGDVEIVRELVEAGSDVNWASDENSLIGFAVVYGNTEIVSLLLEEGADPNATTPKGTPLSRLVGDEALSEDEEVKDKHLERIKLLLEHGANPNAPSSTNYGVGNSDLHKPRPLHLAAASGSIKIVRALLESGAGVTAKHEGNTPAELAEEEGETEVADLLRRHEAESKLK